MIVACFCLLIYCVLPTDCSWLGSSCDGSLCLYLYTGDKSSLTWSAGYDKCASEKLEILRIETSRTQTLAEQLLNKLPDSTEKKAWIGGKRSTDNSWMYMNGTVFSKTITDYGSSDPPPYCLSVRLCSSYEPEYYADNCDEQNGNLGLLCQYDRTDSCNSLDLSIGNKCYSKTRFSGHPGSRIDWYHGQTNCSLIEGEIAYSYLDDQSAIKKVKSYVNKTAQCVQLWLGVAKRPWLWPTDSRSNAGKPINYFNWFDIRNASGDNNCIYVDVDKENKWFSGDCQLYLKYVLCMKTTTNTATTTTTITTTNENTATTTTTTTNENTATTTTTTKTTNENTTGNGSKENIFNPVYISVVVVVVILAIVIGLAVFFILKKKRQASKEHSYLKGDSQQSLSNGQKGDDPEYANVSLAASNDDDDDLIAAGNTEIEHKHAPSGDLYAVSTKQVHKADSKQSKDEGNVEEMYAQPKKNRNKKPKESEVTTEDETTKSGRGMDVVAPSGDLTNSGSKQTEHFEAPSGEVYAKVITK